MRPVLEKLDEEDADIVVGKIIRRKKVTSMPELEESFRRSVEACGKSVRNTIRKSVTRLKHKGKVLAIKDELHYLSQKA